MPAYRGRPRYKGRETVVVVVLVALYDVHDHMMER